MYHYRQDKKQKTMFERTNDVIKACSMARTEQDEKKICDAIFKLSDEKIFELDKYVIAWLSREHSEENLIIANKIRGFYGLRLEVVDYDIQEKDKRTAERIMFEGIFRADVTKERQDKYQILSVKFYNFTLNNKKKKNKIDNSEYIEEINKNSALKTAKERGIKIPSKKMCEALSNYGVPKELVSELNLSDISYILVKANSSKDYLSTKEISSDATPPQKELAWKKLATSVLLVEESTKAMQNMGYASEQINAMWENARTKGNPNIENKTIIGKKVYFELHHITGIKDFGHNYIGNYCIVINEVGGLNSHKPFHIYDDPVSVIMANGKRVLFLTKPVNKNVRFYAGPRKCLQVAAELSKIFPPENKIISRNSISR